MAGVFFGITNRFYYFSYVIGRAEFSGPGFRNAVDMALGADDVIYVLNRSSEHRPDGVRVSVCNFAEEYITEFGSFGQGDGQFTWPTGIAVDSEDNVYVTDEWLNRISVFSKDGEFTGKWGKPGSGDGEVNWPSGMVISSDGTMFLADSRNHRIQKFTVDGQYLGQFGSFGSDPGQLNLPWGITLDKDGLVYVADWRNDRIQQFTPDGEYLARFGQSGSNVGQFNRPSGVAVDQEGDIYVADWGNSRVQVLAPDGRFITEFRGDANLSQWAWEKMASNPNLVQQRSLLRDFSAERDMWHPCTVKVDEQGRVSILDSGRHRIQVYQKDKTPSLKY